MYRLVFLNGKDKGRRLAIREAIITVGRDPDCFLRLSDDEVSRKHAVIEQREDGVYLKDLDATNPTLVNDVPVKETRLHHGDSIEFGNTILQFQTIADPAASEARRSSRTEELATAAVVLIIMAELAFLAYLASRHRVVISEPAQPAAKSFSPVAPAPTAPRQEPAPPRAPAQTEATAQAPAALPAVAETEPESAPPDDAAVAVDELQSLRAEVEALKKQILELPAPAETSSPPETAAVRSDQDAILMRAEAMLRQAALEIARMNYAQADEQLQRIQIMAPDFLPAYIERAKLYEQRGMLKAAGAQWAEVLNRSVGTPLYEQAAAERIRLARLEAMQPASAPAAEPRAESSDRLPRRIRIVDVQQERFPRNEQFDEMRLLRISLKPRPGEKELDPFYVKVVVTFFDENTTTQKIRPTRAIVSKALPVEGPWREGQQKVVSATYIVPQGFREQEFAEHGEKMLYYGYAVQVYYREQLQDVEARPRSLLGLLNRMPQPLHKP